MALYSDLGHPRENTRRRKRSPTRRATLREPVTVSAATPAHLDYLGRYLFRIAIANSRLDCLAEDGTVRFHYRDNRSGDLKTTTLSAEQFISRFLAHVLPERFTKVRYSGLFSSSNRHRLDASRQLLSSAGADSLQASPNSTTAKSELGTIADSEKDPPAVLSAKSAASS
jgi:Putative transposase